MQEGEVGEDSVESDRFAENVDAEKRERQVEKQIKKNLIALFLYSHLYINIL